MIPLEDNHLPIIGWRLLISTVTHPFEYAKVLIQVKYTQSINYLKSKSSLEIYNFNL